LPKPVSKAGEIADTVYLAQMLWLCGTDSAEELHFALKQACRYSETVSTCVYIVNLQQQGAFSLKLPSAIDLTVDTALHNTRG
jgi:hypothetical protein